MKKKKPQQIFLISFLVALCFVFIPRHVVYSEFFSDEYAVSKQMEIVLGESKVLQVSKPKKIAIGDPKIADIVGAGQSEILISAKGVGETNLQIWDDLGQREIVIKVYAENLEKLRKRLEDLFATAGIRGVTFQAGDQERKIFVLGDLPLRRKDVVAQLLSNFTEKIINLVTFSDDSPLVEIDVQILEISKLAVDKLGFTWTSSFTFNEKSPAAGTHNLGRQFSDILKGSWIYQYDRSALSTTLQLLEQDNLARTLARPKLVTLSGKEAKFLAGGQIPILSSVSVASGTATTSVDYVDYGISLNMKPEVKETGDIICKLEVEIKSVDTATQLTISTGSGTTTSTPGFKTRNASTELSLRSGQTLFLAGLISSDETNNLQQFPWLGDIPIVGALFRSKDFQIGDTELVISISPKIVKYGDMQQDIQNVGVPKKENEEPIDTYVRTVQEIILKNISYPLEAQRSNLSGAVVLSLHLLSSGQLAGVVINESSGHKLLDNAAVFTVKRLAPYPAFSKGLMLKEVWVEVPINYNLN